MNFDLANRQTVADLVAVYQQAEKDIRAGFALVDNALGIVGRLFEKDGDAAHLSHYRGRCEVPYRFDDPDEVLIELRRSVWRRLIERMQIRKVMSVRAWKEFDRRINEGEPPAITMEIVEGMIAQTRTDLGKMAEEAVRETFNWLRPPGSRYKTSTEFEIGAKAIVRAITCRDQYCHRWEVNHHHKQDLTALENVFRMLDGRLRRESDGYWSDLQRAIEACPSASDCRGETEYFKFRGCKNGNLHLEFKRPELVAKLNAVAGGATLKPVE